MCTTIGSIEPRLDDETLFFRRRKGRYLQVAVVRARGVECRTDEMIDQASSFVQCRNTAIMPIARSMPDRILLAIR